MKYIRTYETEEKFLTDKDSTSRVFRLKPTLYKYSEAGDHVHLELDDPRKHGDSTYMEITLDSNDLSYNAEFSFYIGNKSGDTQTTMNCSIDWGDGTVETKTITKDDKGFKLAHNYTAGSYKIELYDVERDYSVVEGTEETGMYGDIYYNSSISHLYNVKRVILSEGNSNNSGGVVSIGRGAFGSCSSLTSIYTPKGVTSIDAYIFYGCSSITSIYIPEGVTSIGEYAFKDCFDLTSIYIPEGVTSIGEYAFYDCSLSSVHIPEGVTSIDAYVFYYCSSLTSIYIPEGVTSIGENAFGSCGSLTSINIPEGVTSIGSSAFDSCHSLTSIDIPEGVTSIEDCTLMSCGSLTSINIPEGVTSIGEYAFDSCSSLSSISSFNPTAPTLGTKQVFYRLPANGTLHIKPGATGYDAWLSKLPSGWTIVEDL